MRKNNPVVIPRNHQVEIVLEAANNGCLEPLDKAMSVFKAPYSNTTSSIAYQKAPHPGEGTYQTYCGT